MGVLLEKYSGIKLCETALQRIMSKYGLSARIRQNRKAKPCAGRANRSRDLNNELNREFYAERPLQRLVSDAAYVPYYEDNEWRRSYLPLVQDLYDRSIVAWVFSRKQDDALGSRTLQLLSFRKLSPDVILHTDRGSIYTSNSFRETCRLIGIRQSFSRQGNCHDNASIESFNGTKRAF